MQAQLLYDEPPMPLPADEWQYVAVLQDKSGELTALRRASAQVWERMVPLVQIAGTARRAQSFKASTVRERVKKIAGAVRGNPVYLDVLRLNPMTRIAARGKQVPILEQIYSQARKQGLRFIPVASVGRVGSGYVNLIGDTAVAQGAGLALRYKVAELSLPGGASPADYLDRLLTQFGVDVSAADLFVDFGYIDPDDDLDPASVASLLEGLLEVGSWRKVVILGASIPATLGVIPEGSLGSIDRREWMLWSALADMGLSRMPAFGDYAIQHPRPPKETGPGMRANLRYTAEVSTYVARGIGPMPEEGKAQYQGLCEEIARSEWFAGAEYSWGDHVIAGTAAGSIPPGHQTVWRGAGTSHHLQFITDELRQVEGQSRTDESESVPG